MPTDPTPTPTPREVLAQTLARCREYGGTGLDEWLPRVVEAARADERAALAATGDDRAALRAELFEAQQAGELLNDARREIAALRARVAELEAEAQAPGPVFTREAADMLMAYAAERVAYQEGDYSAIRTANERKLAAARAYLKSIGRS